jgi:hypothetical protein
MKTQFSIFCLSLLLILISCRRNCDADCSRPQKVYKIRVYQSTEDTLSEHMYSNISFTLGVEWAPIDIQSNCCHDILTDRYKSLHILTLEKFNNIYSELDTITSLFKVEYRKCNDIGMPDYEFYNSISDLFISYQEHPIAYGISFCLSEPPDSLRLFHLKIILQLWDDREFVLFTKPLMIKP